MNGNERRNRILKKLSLSKKAVPARELAEIYDVSRQVIVGDVALLRAEGQPIIATNKGYLMKLAIKGMLQKTIAVQHNADETRLELETFIKHKVIVESVTVEHPVYGEITGQLNIQDQNDIEDFLSLEPELLSTLTQGVHIHTLLCPSDINYEELEKELKELNLLYENN